jgi:regulator of sigma E protease
MLEFLLASGELLELFQSVSYWTVIGLKVAIGLGLVIFVHELGHFLVAKWCGVKCEKFYVGFDVPIKLGWGRWGIRLPAALWRKQWGETEYGVGIIPLGGYVKMLGQDDNPAKAADERRRSQVATDGSSGDDDSGEYKLDPRSYLAKSVPQRMAIISAGVIMNIIFAFIFAMIAYGIGLPYVQNVVGSIIPGDAAWKMGLRPGDRIVSIRGSEVRRFDDIREMIILDDAHEGISLVIRRGDQEIPLTLHPDTSRTLTRIGVASASTTSLVTGAPNDRCTVKGTPADATGKFRAGDLIVKIDGEQIDNFRDLNRVQFLKADRPLTYTVRRLAKGSRVDELGHSPGDGEEVTIEVAPLARRRLGIVMQAGPIIAIQKGSPAEKAGLRLGDRLLTIDGRSMSEIDPLKLPDFVAQLAQSKEQVSVTVSREGDLQPVSLQIGLDRTATWYERVQSTKQPISTSVLGVAYTVRNVVDQIVQDGPAEKSKANIQSGDEIVQASIIPAEGNERQERERSRFGLADDPVKFDEASNWPFFELARLQVATPESKVKLTVRRNNVTHDVVLMPYEPAGDFEPERGLVLNSLRNVQRATTIGQAANWAAARTGSAMTAVVKFLKRIKDKPDTARGMAGPIGIIQIAGHFAGEGLPELLIFLTLISANLAVVNFLPIPVLDGGHMIFLAAEGIRGKPVSEKILVPLTWVGLFLILGLVIWTTSLDLQIIPRFLD